MARNVSQDDPTGTQHFNRQKWQRICSPGTFSLLKVFEGRNIVAFPTKDRCPRHDKQDTLSSHHHEVSENI
jgi:hypothetical protein